MPAVPHIDRPLCEPVELHPGATLRVQRVQQGADAPGSAPFPHYHDVAELVLFGRVQGDFIADNKRHPLTDGAIAWIPSLHQHDYALAPGPRDWTLLQIDAHAAEALARAPGGEALAHAFCAKPEGLLATRIAMLGDWLREAAGDPTLAAPLATALLRAAAQAPRIEGEALPTDPDALERLRPAIEQLRRDPAHAPSAEAAAELCALAPAYFSRRFHQQLGMPWSDYVRTHRLHLASQRLLESDQTIADIAAALGFATPSHFGDLFHKRFGLTPNAYRRAGR